MTKKKVTVPRIYKPGKGYPAETLAYLNPMEHELIRQLTDGTYQRGPGGVKSYADDSASSKGVSRGDSSGTKGSGGLGQGGQTGGSTSGSKASSSPSSGVSTGGSGVTGSKGGGASTQSPGAGGNAGEVSRSSLSSASKGLQDQRSTAMGRVSQAAQTNASRSQSSVSQSMPNTVGPDRNWGNVLNTPYNTVFPERAPVTGVAQSFPGRPRPGANALGVPRVHAGLDFGVKPGSPVTPAMPGKVVQVAYSPGAYGPTVQVMNTAGVIDRYALHQKQDVPVKVGQSVYPDTVLGYAGKLPGNPNNFSHLHYERLTSADPGYKTIQQGIASGALAKNRGGVVGSSSSYSRQTGANVPNSALNSSTREWASAMGIGQGESVQRGASLRGPTSGAFASTQVAGMANAGLADAMARERAQKAAQAASAMSGLGAMQGPPQPPQGIPAPNSFGINPSRYSGYGNFTPPATVRPAAAPPPNTVSGMSYNPPVSPLGTLPAARPKEIQLAWNMPPMGGAVPSQYGDLFGVWGSNRPQPKGPAATPGTIHTKTAATTDSAPSLWESGSNWVKAKTDQVTKAVEDVKADPGYQKLAALQKVSPGLAEALVKMAMGGGSPGTSGLGMDQDRSRMNIPAQQPQQPRMAAPAAPVSANPLTVLQNLHANMVAQGASPEQIAYVQSLIEQLTNPQVA